MALLHTRSYAREEPPLCPAATSDQYQDASVVSAMARPRPNSRTASTGAFTPPTDRCG